MDRRIPIEVYSDRSTRRRARRRRLLVRAIAAGLVLVAIGFALSRVLPSVPRALLDERSAEETAAAEPVQPTAEAAGGEVAQSATPPEPSGPPTITVAAVGDMIFDRKVEELISAQGGEAPLSEVAERLENADVALGNLESMIAEGGTRNTAKDYTFLGDPAAIEGLKAAGFDALSIANNHTLDYGSQPVADSIASLDSAGIGHSGAGPNVEAAWKPATVESGGAKVAYLAFTHILPPGFLAGEDRWGVASGRMDMSLVTDAVKQAKESHDYVVVSFHWGVEYEDYANADQVKNAHRVIDAGADMVLAHHPHVIQGVEYYKNRLIAYSLGDFVFDHYSRKTGEAFILEAELGPEGVANAVAVPVYLDGNGKPEYVHGEEATVILKRLAKISKPHGTNVRIDKDVAHIMR